MWTLHAKMYHYSYFLVFLFRNGSATHHNAKNMPLTFGFLGHNC